MKKTVLLIEDNIEVRENTAEILELANFNVLTAENGKIGVSIAKEAIPDIIICDIMMPIMDGYDTLYMLNLDPKTSVIPFIFLTAKSEKTDMRKGMSLGADDYLTKPFEEVDLIKAIEARLKRSHALKIENEEEKTFDFFVNKAKLFSELKNFTEDKKVKNYDKKEMIYLQDSFPKYLYYVEYGKIKTFKSNTNTKEFITGLYSKGDFFGYKSLISESNYSESAVALEDSKIAIISKENFFDLIYKNRDVANNFIKMLSSDIEEKEKELITLAYDSLRKRVAEGLIKYYDKYKVEKNCIHLTRDNLASLVGATTESVIRTLSEFKNDKLININGKTIEILNEEELRNYKY